MRRQSNQQKTQNDSKSTQIYETEQSDTDYFHKHDDMQFSWKQNHHRSDFCLFNNLWSADILSDSNWTQQDFKL